MAPICLIRCNTIFIEQAGFTLRELKRVLLGKAAKHDDPGTHVETIIGASLVNQDYERSDSFSKPGMNEGADKHPGSSLRCTPPWPTSRIHFSAKADLASHAYP